MSRGNAGRVAGLGYRRRSGRRSGCKAADVAVTIDDVAATAGLSAFHEPTPSGETAEAIIVLTSAT